MELVYFVILLQNQYSMSDRKCLNCETPVFGRSDKKFCSDDCRNEYNYAHNKDITNEVRRVNRILRKNRNILKELNPKGKAKYKKKRLLKEGLNLNYFTSMYQAQNGNTYFFCYDQGYIALDNDWYALVEKQEYAD